MDIIWMIMKWIVYGFEIFGIGMIFIWIPTAIFNPGANERIDKIRNYILMLDDEDY